MSGLTPIAAIPVAGVIGAIVMAGLLLVAALRIGAFDRLGALLAGDNKQRREALARTGTDEGAAKVARFAGMLTDGAEVRLIRWTPARTADGVRIALGASPVAWYLWLPVPMVLMRVPDSFVAQMHHDDRGDGVVALRCELRDCDDVVTATDGVTVEEAADSFELAQSLFEGLVMVDPVAKAPARSRREARAAAAAEAAAAAVATPAMEAATDTEVAVHDESQSDTGSSVAVSLAS